MTDRKPSQHIINLGIKLKKNFTYFANKISAIRKNPATTEYAAFINNAATKQKEQISAAYISTEKGVTSKDECEKEVKLYKNNLESLTKGIDTLKVNSSDKQKLSVLLCKTIDGLEKHITQCEKKFSNKADFKNAPIFKA